MNRLDQNRPFGTLYGVYDGRRYEQDGAFFRADGSPWAPPDASPAPEPPAAPAPVKRGRKPAKPKVDL